MQRGAAPAQVYMIGGLTIVLAGFWFFGGDDPQVVPQQDNRQEVLAEVEVAGTRTSRSIVTFDNKFGFSGGSVFYWSDMSASGEKQYKELVGADAGTFQKIGTAAPSSGVADTQPSSSGVIGQGQSTGQTPLGFSSGSTESSGISYSITFYSDDNTVYIVVESGGQTSAPVVIAGADPDSFQILNVEYVKDEDWVYIIEVVCSGLTCVADVSVVEGADPDTFQAFPNATEVLSTDCSAYVTVDGQDQFQMFNNGEAVDGVSVYLIGKSGRCDDTPVLISP